MHESLYVFANTYYEHVFIIHVYIYIYTYIHLEVCCIYNGTRRNETYILTFRPNQHPGCKGYSFTNERSPTIIAFIARKQFHGSVSSQNTDMELSIAHKVRCNGHTKGPPNYFVCHTLPGEERGVDTLRKGNFRS